MQAKPSLTFLKTPFSLVESRLLSENASNPGQEEGTKCETASKNAHQTIFPVKQINFTL